MSGFSLSVPADPKWLNVVHRTAAVAASDIAFDVDVVDDLGTAITRVALGLSVLEGVERLEIRAEVGRDRLDLRIVGVGSEVADLEASREVLDSVRDITTGGKVVDDEVAIGIEFGVTA
jgi:hypothetical protein